MPKVQVKHIQGTTLVKVSNPLWGIEEALDLQKRAKEEGVDTLEIINREMSTQELEGYENPFLDEEGKPYHDTPERL